MNHALKSAISLPTFQKSITLWRNRSWMQTLWWPESPSVLTCLVLTLELGVSVRRGALILGVNTAWNTEALTNYQWWICKWSKNKYSSSPISVCCCLVSSKIHRNINPPGMFSNGLCSNISICGNILEEANNYLLLARSTYCSLSLQGQKNILTCYAKRNTAAG